MLHRARTLLLATVAVILAASFSPAAAQDLRDPAMNIQWWHPLAVGAGTGVLFLIDEPIADFLQDNQGSFGDDVAEFANKFKDPPVYAVATAGTLALGLATGNRKITVTGLHIAGAYGLAGAANIGIKWMLGRSRPSQTPDDPTNFNLFDGGENSAFPSGSAAVTYSLAAVLSDAIDRRPVSVVLYSAAGLNAWSRVYQNKHWISDVVLGGILGVTTAKLINGRWNIAGFRLPTATPSRDGMRLGYTLRF